MTTATEFSTPMIAMLAKEVKARFYSAKLEGLSDQAAFEELVKVILETYSEFREGR